MAADIYTKAFTNGEKWKWACELINIVPKDRLRDLVLHSNPDVLSDPKLGSTTKWIHPYQ